MNKTLLNWRKGLLVAGLSLACAMSLLLPMTANAKPVGVDAKQLTNQLNQYTNTLISEQDFSGVVLVAKDGKSLFRRAMGQRNIVEQLPMDVDTKLNLGSMNKMFTAVAIAQLVEKGLVKFEEKLSAYLPDFPNKTISEQVTIHQLLSHTSGLGSYWNEAYSQKYSELRMVDDYLPIVSQIPLDFTPGEKFQYSNTGFHLLGMVVEKVSGEDYHDYVKKHIFAPLGMKNTDSYEVDDLVENRALGYYTVDAQYATPSDPEGTLKTNHYVTSVRGMPAGGGYSTVDDLLLFANGLMSNKLISQKMFDTLTAKQVQMLRRDGSKGSSYYGYGFGGMDKNDVNAHTGHNGGAPGIGAMMYIYPNQGITAIALTNKGTRAIFGLKDKVESLIGIERPHDKRKGGKGKMKRKG